MPDERHDPIRIAFYTQISTDEDHHQKVARRSLLRRPKVASAPPVGAAALLTPRAAEGWQWGGVLGTAPISPWRLWRTRTGNLFGGTEP